MKRPNRVTRSDILLSRVSLNTPVSAAPSFWVDGRADGRDSAGRRRRPHPKDTPVTAVGQ